MADSKKSTGKRKGGAAGKTAQDRTLREPGAGEHAGPFPGGQWFLEKEQSELERRRQDTVKEMRRILEHIPLIRRTPQEGLHEVDGAERGRRLARALFDALLEGETRPELKRTVARRMADRIGRYLLRNRISSLPSLHEIYALFPWWASQLPIAGVDRIRDLGLAYVLNGMVLPVQTVWRELLESKSVFIGHCVCRSSGIVDDLPAEKEFRNLLDEDGSRRLMDRIIDSYLRLKAAGDLAGTDPAYLDLMEELSSLRGHSPARALVERLLRTTYPEWEFLPVHPRYTTDWIRSMYQNRKAKRIHKELAFEMATILFLAHGIIFTSMRMVDTPYTICSCPSPELGGGCLLTNWYYFGRSNASLLPNEQAPGRNRDENGALKPCRYFEVRAERECLGCGCLHDAPNPRDPDLFLADADRMLAAYRGSDGSRAAHK